MLERKIKLYSIDELSDEAQDHVIKREKENIYLQKDGSTSSL